MKLIISILLVGLPLVAFAQFNIQGDAVAGGYDVTAYFENRAIKGNKEIAVTYKGAEFWFSNAENRKTFLEDPERYIPRYGGWCAYAMGTSGEKVKIDPETFEIRDGKLYLFYNAFFNNTLDKWLDEGPEKLKVSADRNWSKIKKIK